jgi:hypothetical protein
MFVPGSAPVRPFHALLPNDNDLSYFSDCANEHYDSFQGQVKINAWAGWTLQGSYTYQKQWGPGWGPYDTNYYFFFDRPAGYGYIDQFPHNQITIAQTYDIPFGRGKKYGSSISRALDYALGGWSISGVTTYYSGLPFAPTLEDYSGKPKHGPNNRPDKGRGDPYSGAAGNRNQWFVGGLGTTFLAPPAGAFGNYPINTLIGPHFTQ